MIIAVFDQDVRVTRAVELHSLLLTLLVKSFRHNTVHGIVYDIDRIKLSRAQDARDDLRRDERMVRPVMTACWLVGWRAVALLTLVRSEVSTPSSAEASLRTRSMSLVGVDERAPSAEQMRLCPRRIMHETSRVSLGSEIGLCAFDL